MIVPILKMLLLLLVLLRIVNSEELKETEGDKIISQRNDLSEATTAHDIKNITVELTLMKNISNTFNITKESEIKTPKLNFTLNNFEKNNKSSIKDDLDVISKNKNLCHSQNSKCLKHIDKYNTTDVKPVKQKTEESSLEPKENYYSNNNDSLYSSINQKLPNKSKNDTFTFIETSKNNETLNTTNKVNVEASTFVNETEAIEAPQINPISLEILEEAVTVNDDLLNKSRSPEAEDKSIKPVSVENVLQNSSQEIRHNNSNTSDIYLLTFETDEAENVKIDESDDVISILDVVPFNETVIQVPTPIRKCCETHQFFSLTTHWCENSTQDPMFIANSKQLIKNNSSNNITLVPGRLTECPNTNAGPRSSGIDSLSHSLSSLGILHHLESDKKYDLDRYCIEMAAYDAEEVSSAIMILAFCPYETLVRKCCDSGEFFNMTTGQCEVSETDTKFEQQTNYLLEADALKTIELKTGTLTSCPTYDDEIRIFGGVTNLTHSIHSSGHLIEKENRLDFDHERYCLEMVASENGIKKLTAAFCTKKSQVVKIRKCCELDQYFNTDLNDCISRPQNISNHEQLVEAITYEPFSQESFFITSARLKCPQVPIEIRDLNEFYLDLITGDLCEYETHFCYPLSNYCIEDFSSKSENIVNHKAEICPSNYFKKCCKLGQKITEDGCTDVYDYPSLHMEQLLQTMKAAYGSPEKPGCTPYPLGTAHEPDQPERFFVTSSGHLSLTVPPSLTSDDIELTTKNYCVDDYIDSANITHLYAIVCDEELFPQHTRPASLNSLPLGTVGKCCPLGHHIVIKDLLENSSGYTTDCVSDNNYYDMFNDHNIIAANITNITFTNLPLCENEQGYHKYELSSMDEGDVFLDALETLIVVDKYGKCIRDETPVYKDKYCLDYETNGSNFKTIAIICQSNWNNYDILHSERQIIITVFLGVSCAALIATAVSLVSTRVRRGLVTVKKVNTLAGRILLSYVMSYLLGFLALAVSQKTDIKSDVDYDGCRAIAGIIMFFMLAAFNWNTSICLESLLLTLRVSTSEGRRYILHSLWAWGLPGFITALALSLDAYRESLPCSTITPEIGVFRCFFSDSRAQLLYFYLPMFITLVANLGLLLAARAVRIHNLRKLEHGPNRRKKGDAVEGTELQGRGRVTDANTKTEKQAAQNKEPNTTHSSGMRTHQNRNLWLEAVKLVMWSGVTLSIEVVSYFVFRFREVAYESVAYEAWHEYLWYIPSIVNSLRGLGIFVILVLTEENRKKLAKALGSLSFLAGGSGSSPRQTHSAYSSDDSAVGNSSIGGNGGRRNMSVTTTITQISSIRNKCINNGKDVSINPCSDASPHQRVAKSVSQIERHGSISSESDLDGLEVDTDGSRRRPSLAVVAMTALESVDEEDVFDQQMISNETMKNTNNVSIA